MLLVQLSDPHVGARGGSDTEADLAAAVERVVELRPAPDAVLVSGDLTNRGRPEQYARARELLAPLPGPVHVLAGNHDDRAELERALGAPARFAVRAGALRLIACHTARPGRDDGALGAGERAWLADRLAEDRRTPTIVAMHHPPLPIGIPLLDSIGLPAEDRAALAALLEGAPNVVRVVAGHVHLAATGMLGRVAVTTAPSVWRMRPRLVLGEPGYEPANEPAGFLVHALVDGRLVTHVQPL